MSAILRSRVARQVLTGTRGFASVPEVMVSAHLPRTRAAERASTEVVIFHPLVGGASRIDPSTVPETIPLRNEHV